MPPGPIDLTVLGRPAALDHLARVAGEVAGRWRARSVLLVDALEAAAAAELRGVWIDGDPARRLGSTAARIDDAGEAIAAFAQALRSVDHRVDHRGVTRASQASVERWLAAHGDERTDPAVAAILGRLPDGQRRSLEDFEEMTASERMAWIDAFATTSDDRLHRTINGVLAYFADSRAIRGDDRRAFGGTWWSVADAAVLLVIQDGWLRQQGLPRAADRPHRDGDPRRDAYEDAVDAWAAHVDAVQRGEVSDHELLRSWVRAEEAGVVFAELAVAYAWRFDPAFVPPTREEWEAIIALAPGTHTFRLSIDAGTQREFLLAITDAVLAHGLEALVETGGDLGPLGPAGGVLPPDLVDATGDAIADIGGSWTDGWGLGAVTNLVGGTIGAAGTAYRFGVDTASWATDTAIAVTARGIREVVTISIPDRVEFEVARGLVDPTVVPPPWLREAFDRLLGTDRADEGLSFTYYFPVLMEAGWIPALPHQWVDPDGETHTVAPPVQAGSLRTE